MNYRLTITSAIVLLLTFGGQATAGPLLDAALDATARVAATCAAATAQGEEAALQQVNSGLWSAGRLLNGLFGIIAPGVPVLAHLDTARPPSHALVGVHPNDLECFRNGYRRVAKQERTKAAWLGFAGGAAVFFVIFLHTRDS